VSHSEKYSIKYQNNILKEGLSQIRLQILKYITTNKKCTADFLTTMSNVLDLYSDNVYINKLQ